MDTVTSLDGVTSPVIYVWIGKKGTATEKTEAMNTAQKFIKDNKYPEWIQVIDLLICSHTSYHNLLSRVHYLITNWFLLHQLTRLQELLKVPNLQFSGSTSTSGEVYSHCVQTEKSSCNQYSTV